MGLFGIIKAILLVVVAYRVLDVIPLDSFFLMDPQELHAIAKVSEWTPPRRALT